MSGITKCDSLLLQTTPGNTKCDSYYKVRRNTVIIPLDDFLRNLKTLKILELHFWF